MNASIPVYNPFWTNSILPAADMGTAVFSQFSENAPPFPAGHPA